MIREMRREFTSRSTTRQFVKDPSSNGKAVRNSIVPVEQQPGRLRYPPGSTQIGDDHATSPSVWNTRA